MARRWLGNSLDPLLPQIGQHLLGRVGISPHVAVRGLAPVPVGSWEEGVAAPVLLRKVLLLAAVREGHDMALTVHDEDSVAHDGLPEMW